MGGFSGGGSKVTPGTVEWFAGSGAPAGWLSCNGALVSRATYAALFLAIGTTYGAGDGSTTFGIPDLRGEFMRGADGGRGVDSGRVMGSAQGASVISNKINAAGSLIVTGEDSVSATSQVAINGTGVSGGSSLITIRPRNVAMLPCIKF